MSGVGYESTAEVRNSGHIVLFYSCKVLLAILRAAVVFVVSYETARCVVQIVLARVEVDTTYHSSSSCCGYCC